MSVFLLFTKRTHLRFLNAFNFEVISLNAAIKVTSEASAVCNKKCMHVSVVARVNIMLKLFA